MYFETCGATIPSTSEEGTYKNMSKYNEGQIVYIVASGSIIQEVTVEEIHGRDYILSLQQGGRITMPEERIYPSQQGAESQLKKVQEKRKKKLSYMDKIKKDLL